MNRPSDVIVIGAGIIGCSIAYELACRGIRVRVFDGRAAGLGATQASAGVLAPFIEGARHATLRELGVRSLSLFDDFVARVTDDSGVPVHYSRTGTIEIALDEAALDRLRESAAVASAPGIRAVLLDASEARAAEPQLSADVVGGLLVEGHGFVQAGGLTDALTRACAAKRVEFICPCRVISIEHDSRGLRVTTGDTAAWSASTVILAAGSWSREIALLNGAGLPVKPVRGQLLHLSWPATPLGRVTWGPHCYLVPWSDGSLLVGATVEDVGFDERATTAGVRDLLEALCDLVPAGWQAGFESVRVGLRPATPDELPIIGWSQRTAGLLYATGHYRNGVLLAPLTAALVADLVATGRSDPALDVLTAARFGDY
jgi:glycine oxidase